MFRSLSGYRTYIVGWLWLTATVVALSQGWIDGTQATEWAMNALGILGLRAGLHSVAGDDSDEDRLADAIGDLLEHANAPRPDRHLQDFEREQVAVATWRLARTYGDTPARNLPELGGPELVAMLGYEAARVTEEDVL